ncbi:MAG: hypothetical protein U5K84_09420 [Alkalibacterium sp.]|nr:hypothetical protein [Alkalibacterium sp.]
MLFSDWIDAERFYTFIIPSILVIFLIMLLFYVIVFTYLKKGTKLRKNVNAALLVLMFASVLYFIGGHINYRYWVEQNDYINPGIREYSYLFGIRNEEEPETVEIYKNSDELYSNLSSLNMYESHQISQSFDYTYYGSQSGTHYFLFGEEEEYVFRIRGEINWTGGHKEMTGQVFHLSDDRYQDIGFIPEFNTIFESVSLPENEQREIGSLKEYQVVEIEDVFSDWVFSNQRY